jgi:hypothetical protein
MLPLRKRLSPRPTGFTDWKEEVTKSKAIETRDGGSRERRYRDGANIGLSHAAKSYKSGSNRTKIVQLAPAKNTATLTHQKKGRPLQGWEDSISQSEFIKAQQSAKTPLCYAGSRNAGYTNNMYIQNSLSRSIREVFLVRLGTLQKPFQYFIVSARRVLC